jgi:hypothetical protein
VERAADAGASGAFSPESLRALLARAASTPPPSEVEQSLLELSSLEFPPLTLPAELPVLPLRNTLLSVGAVAPIQVGRASSLAALEAAQCSVHARAAYAARRDLTSRLRQVIALLPQAP